MHSCVVNLSILFCFCGESWLIYPFAHGLGVLPVCRSLWRESRSGHRASWPAVLLCIPAFLGQYLHLEVLLGNLEDSVPCSFQLPVLLTWKVPSTAAAFCSGLPRQWDNPSPHICADSPVSSTSALFCGVRGGVGNGMGELAIFSRWASCFYYHSE